MTQLLKKTALLLTLLLTICTIFVVWYYQSGFIPTTKANWSWLLESYLPRYQAYPYDLVLSSQLVIGTGVMLFLIQAMIYSRASTVTIIGGRKVKDTHGSARWATWKEIKKQRLLEPSGLVVGGFKKGRKVRELFYAGKQHILAFCPTGSGKGVSLVLPTLLRWKESAFVLDIKEENYALSAGYRKSMGQNVLVLKPANPENSASYNPLDCIRVGTDFEVADCQALAVMVMDPDGKGIEGDFWKTSSYEWLFVCLLHISHKIKKQKGRNANFSDLYSFMNTNDLLQQIQKDGSEKKDDNEDDEEENESEKIFNALTQSMLDFNHLTGTANSIVHGLALSMRDMAHVTRTGIHKNASTPLGLFADPRLARVSATSSFTMDDLVNQENPTTLYLCIPAKEIGRLKPYARMVFTQLLDTLCTDLEFSSGRSTSGKKHRLLLMLDEFTALGKIEKFETALPYIRGYGMQAYIVIQDVKQLNKYYRKDNSIFSNCDVRIAFAANDPETAKLISDMCGKTTLVQRKRSSSIGGKDIGGGSESQSEVARPLLTPNEVEQELQKLDTDVSPVVRGNTLTFMRGYPIFGEQALYFDNKELARQAAMAPPQMPPLPPLIEQPVQSQQSEQIPHDPETGEVLED